MATPEDPPGKATRIGDYQRAASLVTSTTSASASESCPLLTSASSSGSNRRRSRIRVEAASFSSGTKTTAAWGLSGDVCG